MADLDLSLVATFDTTSVEAGGTKTEQAIDKVSNAEKRANETTRTSKKVTDDAARAERDRARAIDEVRSAIDPAYNAQKKMNGLLEQARQLHRENAISLTELTRVEKLHEQAMKGGAATAGQARAAYANVAFQIQDITQSVALGINPFVVFGQQAGQLASAMATTANRATLLGRAITFLASPAGSIVVGAITIIGLLASTMGKAEDASDDLSGALDFQRMSHEALGKAIKEQRKEAEESVALSYQQITAARDLARANLEAALSERERLAATLARARVDLANAAGEAQFQTRRVALEAAERDVNDNAAQKAELERILRLREIPIVRREIEAATDAAAAATLRAEKAEAALNHQYAEGAISKGLYERQLENIRKKRDADIQAIREQEREQKRLNKETEKAATYAEFGAPIAGGRITSGLSTARRNPVTGKVRPHNGIDIAAPTGTRVSAPQVGVVEAVGYSSSLGKYVVIDHGGGTKTRYGHLSDNSFVRKGDAVEKGDQIGKVGSTGRSTGPHLHYEVLVNGKPVDPSKGKFPIDDVKVAEAAKKAADDLQAFGDKASESIQRVNERFNAQPRLIDQAAQATRQLDDVIAELSERQPIGWEDMVEQARNAKGVIADSLLRPFEELREESERRMQIEQLIAANREDEAEALKIIWQFEEKLGPLSEERKRDILDMVVAERELSEVLAAREEILDAYLGASRAARSEIEAILSGQGKLSNFKQIFKNLNARVLTEQLFGGIFRDFDKWVKEETAISSSVDLMRDETERAGRAAGDFADALNDATERTRFGAYSGATPTGSFISDMDAVIAEIAKGEGGTGSADGEIVVSAIKSGVNGLSPERYFEELTRRLTRPLLAGLDDLLGTKFFGGLEGVLSKGATGYLTGGIPGGILGGLSGIKGLPETLDKLTGVTDTLGKGLKGAQTGTMVSGLGDMLGIKNSKTGAQVGGAIGSFLPIPGGDIIGAIAGGLLGGLFKKTKYGTATISGIDSVSAVGRGKGRVDGATGLAGSVTDGIRNIADALDAELGSFNVSIGTYKDKYRVSASGKTGKLKGGDVRDFGDDQAAAIAYAIADAISDGAIVGISPAVAAALRSNSDVEKAVAEALKVKDLELQLRRLDDPIAGIFDEFLATAKERVDLARKYGLDLAKVEKLNAKERQAIVDEAIEQQVGSLKRLLEDLDYGSLFEGSAVERRDKIRAEIEDAKQDVAAGVAGSTDRLAELERQLVETSKSAFGTAGPEYAADLNEARTTAERIIKEEEARIKAAAEATAKGLELANETNDLLAGVNGRLDTLIAGIGGLGGNYGNDVISGLYLRNARFTEVQY